MEKLKKIRATVIYCGHIDHLKGKTADALICGHLAHLQFDDLSLTYSGKKRDNLTPLHDLAGFGRRAFRLADVRIVTSKECNPQEESPMFTVSFPKDNKQ